MAKVVSSSSCSTTAGAQIVSSSVLIVLLLCPTAYGGYYNKFHDHPTKSDLDLLEFPLNLEYLEAEFFLWGSLGYGLDKFAPNLTANGPPPSGVKMAKLDPFTKDVILQFAYQEVGHLRAIRKVVKGFPRPLLNLSAEAFGVTMEKAIGKKLKPSFDPYANEVNFLLASYLIPYVGLTGYVGAIPKLKSSTAKRLVAGLLAVESGQDAVIRALLYKRAKEKVKPYSIKVAEFTNKMSDLRNKLGSRSSSAIVIDKDEGLYVNKAQGAEGKVQGNVLAGDTNSVAYDRTPQEILRIVYGTGTENKPGAFYPNGASGKIAKSFLLL